MKTLSPLIKTAAKYGAVAGPLGFILMVTMYYMGSHPFFILIFFDFRVILFSVFIFFSLKEYRDFHQDGVLSFPEGMVGSFLFVTIFSCIVSLALLLFEIAVPQFLNDYISLSIEKLKTLPPDIVERIGKSSVESNLQTMPSTDIYALPKLYLFQS